MAVYFVQENNERGNVKIGYAADIEARFHKIQSMSPSELVLRAVIPNGDHDLERAIHKHFNNSRLHGEWFGFTLQLHSFMDDCNGASTEAARERLGIKKQRTTRRFLQEKAPEIAVEILAATIKEMKDAGLLVAVKNVTAKPDRPAGIIVFIGDVAIAEGALAYAPAPEKVHE